MRTLVAIGMLGCAPHPVELAPLSSELANEGSLRQRLAAPDNADLVILYGGEQEGSMETCGCDERQLGSLARVASYRKAVHRRGSPTILVNTGYWLDDAVDAQGALRPDAVLANEAMIEGLASWEALNVGWRDAPHLEAHGAPPNAVSVEGPGSPVLVLRIGDLDIAVTGVTGEGALDALRTQLPAMISEDLVLVLAYDVGRDARAIAREPGVDVLIEASGYQERYPPVVEEAVWVRSDKQTQRLGELRLVVEEGRVVAALDRLIDLDERIPSDRALGKLERDTRERIDALQQELYALP